MKRTDSRSLRVLLIDDDAEFRETIAGGLRHRGHDAVAAADGHSAATRVAETAQPFDVIVSDYNLGLRDSRNGIEICEALRPLQPDARYVLMSGLDRQVPDWIRFAPKEDFGQLFDIVTGPASTGGDDEAG